MPEWSEFWWTAITGPRNLCDAVSRALHNKSSVCLLVPDDLPWRDEMRACIETRDASDAGHGILLCRVYRRRR